MNILQRFVLLIVIVLKSSISYSQQQGVEDSLFYKCFRKGQQLIQLKEYDSSYYYLNKAKKGFLKQKDNVGLAKTYLSYSSLYGYKNLKDSANFYLLECQNIVRTLKDNKLQANIYINLAFLKYQHDDLFGALEYAHIAERIHLKEKDSTSIAVVYNNLAILYKRVADFKKALRYNEKSLIINKLLKDSVGIGYAFNNIGSVFEDISESDSARIYFQKAIIHNKKFNIKNANPYKSLAKNYQNRNKLNISTDYYLKALEIDNQNANELKNIFKELRDNFIGLKDYKKIGFYQKKIDSLEIKELVAINLEKLKQLESQQKLYLKEQELKHANAVNEKNNIIFFVVLGLLVLTLLFFLQSNRTNLLKRKQDRLLLESKVLRAQMNPHFIFNALTAIQNSLMDGNPLQSATYLSRFSKLIRQNFDFVNKERITLAEDIDALKNYIETQLMRFDNTFEYLIEIDNAIEDSLVEIPPLLIQPFVENSIEHGFKNKSDKGYLKIVIVKQSQFILIHILDNGVGFDTKRRATEEHSFSIVKKRLRLLSKTAEKSLKINSSSKGTEVQFKININ